VKLSKTLVLPIAGLLLVGAAGAVMATSGSPTTTGGAGAIVPAAEAATPTPSVPAKPAIKDPLLTDVLDRLVTKGTITAAQKTAILDAVGTERTARRTERQQARQQLKSFLADGQITQDELNQLPADSPLRKLTSLMADGKITVAELRGIRRALLGGGMGGGLRGAPNASPAPRTGAGG
jgi:hypothetical protein